MHFIIIILEKKKTAAKQAADVLRKQCHNPTITTYLGAVGATDATVSREPSRRLAPFEVQGDPRGIAEAPLRDVSKPQPAELLGTRALGLCSASLMSLQAVMTASNRVSRTSGHGTRRLAFYKKKPQFFSIMLLISAGLFPLFRKTRSAASTSLLFTMKKQSRRRAKNTRREWCPLGTLLVMRTIPWKGSRRTGKDGAPVELPKAEGGSGAPPKPEGGGAPVPAMVSLEDTAVSGIDAEP